MSFYTFFRAETRQLICASAVVVEWPSDPNLRESMNRDLYVSRNLDAFTFAVILPNADKF